MGKNEEISLVQQKSSGSLVIFERNFHRSEFAYSSEIKYFNNIQKACMIEINIVNGYQLEEA